MYGSKTKYQRRYARKGRSSVARMAKGKSTKTRSLAGAIKRLQLAMRRRRQYVNLNHNFSTSCSSDYVAANMCFYAGFNQVFGTGADDLEGNKMIHHSFGAHIRISLENTINEPDTTGFTVFLVSLKDAIGSAFDPAAGTLTLVPNQHYVQRSGMVLLNKKALTIHKMKKFTLTNYGQALGTSAAQSQYGTDCRWYWKISPRKTVYNPVGNWSVLNSALDPSKTYFLLVFNDNSTLDLQSPKLEFNSVHTIEQLS